MMRRRLAVAAASVWVLAAGACSTGGGSRAETFDASSDMEVADVQSVDDASPADVAVDGVGVDVVSDAQGLDVIGADVAAFLEAGACGDGGAQQCGAPMSCAPPITIVESSQQPPTSHGGQVVPGLYVLVGATAYGITGVPTRTRSRDRRVIA